MTTHVDRHPTAVRDLDVAADYIQRRGSPERAIRFLRSADSTFARLAGRPGIGARYESDVPLMIDLRFFPVSRFKNYLVFYRPIAGGIEVLRVLHGARDIQHILADDFGDADDEPAEGGGRD